MDPTYSYVPAAGKYFCLQGSLVSLASLLLLHAGSLHLETLGIRRKQVPAILKVIARSRKNTRQTAAEPLSLPAFGHLCIRIHRGYKVFDFSALTTTKIFDPDADETAAAAEIAAVRRASPLAFAPTLLHTDPGNRWYTETFLPGAQSPKTGQSDPKDLFDRVIADHLAGIILLEPLRTTGLADYWHGIRDSLYTRLQHAGYEDELRNAIQRFVDSIAARLEATADRPIHLAFTHGDFSFVNFMQNHGKISVIDWESAQTRSLHHDLYNYFLTERYYQRTQSNLVTEMADAISQLGQRLGGKASAPVSFDAETTDVYRRLYFLERMDMLMGRELAGPGLNVLRRSIDIFAHHEADVSTPL